MNKWDSLMLTALYSGTAHDKLTMACRLHAAFFQQPAATPGLIEELELLRQEAGLLAGHMCEMNLPALCSQCAAGKGGGCCSAYMADNTDSVQILINLMLGVTVNMQADSSGNCCFLGRQGCLFLIKPIFCLNYNCTAIIQNASQQQMALLYRRMGDVLSRQTAIESMLLQCLRRQFADVPGWLALPSRS